MSKWSAYDAFTRDELRVMSRAIQYGEISWVTIMDTRTDYERFIASKRQRAATYGFEPGPLNKHLKPWQADIVRWACRRGRAALFADTGLGKTLMQLSFADQIVRRSGRVLILCPLGVRQQTVDEAEKFGIAAQCVSVSCDDECVDGINVTNYDRLDKFNSRQFNAIILDESSILKSMTGKIRTRLLEMFSRCEYRLACTATPAPNDHMELGNHAQFLSVMNQHDMLNRFFYHDSGNTSKWVLRPHGHDDFWAWVASWAVCIEKPSDIGGSDEGYDLPPMQIHRHIVEVDCDDAPNGFLFNVSGISATSIHEEKRLTCGARVAKAASIVNDTAQSEPVIVWCDTNEESQRLTESIQGACELRGSDTTSRKEQLLRQFASGEVTKLVTKPSICGMGLNWQHCKTMVFAGLTYSFESFYQAVRRIYRFGQMRNVDIHIVLAESDNALNATIARKESDFMAMRSGMASAMRNSTWQEFGLDSPKQQYAPQESIVIPSFIDGANTCQ